MCLYAPILNNVVRSVLEAIEQISQQIAQPAEPQMEIALTCTDFVYIPVVGTLDFCFSPPYQEPYC
jgi:hypothetical protein